MIKTPLSTVLGGAFWTPGCTVVGGASKTLNQIIKSLFANNEQGFAYDPNDLSTMFQDAAGTVPVTAAGQAVGLIRDKSGRNNHAYQATSASRPILRQNAVTGAYYLEFDGADDYLQVSNLALPAPFTASFAIDHPVLSRAVLFSAARTGYFISENGRAGVYGNPTQPLHKTPKDVITYKVTSSPQSQIEIQTGIDSGVVLQVNSFDSTDDKYIGRFDPTGLAKFNGGFYGVVVINKLLTSGEESAFRVLLNKRMEI